MALRKRGEVTIRQVIADLHKGRISGIVKKQRDALRAAGQVHFLEDAFLVAVQAAGAPTACVQTPQTVAGCRADPQGGELGGFLFLAFDGEADIFHLGGKVVTHGNAGAIAIVADQEDERNGRVIEHEFAVCAHGRAHGFHFSDNDFLALFEVVSIVGFEAACDINHAGVIHQLSGQREEFWQGAAGKDFLVDVVAVNQPVRRLADLEIREGVQLGGVGEDSRVKHETIVGAIGLCVAQIGSLDVCKLVGSQTIAEKVNGSRADLRNGRLRVDNRVINLVQPAAVTGGRRLGRHCGGNIRRRRLGRRRFGRRRCSHHGCGGTTAGGKDHACKNHQADRQR